MTGGDTTPVAITFRKLYDWINRYINEGATEEFLNDLNSDLHPISYARYVVPSDFYLSESMEPQCVYVANLNILYSPESVAAKEFSNLIVRGMLKRLRRCQMDGCENIFLGPPQAKWCSPTCGSKFRVRKKRKRDMS